MWPRDSDDSWSYPVYYTGTTHNNDLMLCTDLFEAILFIDDTNLLVKQEDLNMISDVVNARIWTLQQAYKMGDPPPC